MLVFKVKASFIQEILSKNPETVGHVIILMVSEHLWCTWFREALNARAHAIPDPRGRQVAPGDRCVRHRAGPRSSNSLLSAKGSVEGTTTPSWEGWVRLSGKGAVRTRPSEKYNGSITG